jgi:hypothetical protein
MRQPLVEHRLELAGFESRALELEGEGPPLHLVEALGDRDDFAYELYEGCGHCPQVEMPERLAASMLTFACS